MWVIRILSGPQAGKTFPLQTGANIIGREPSCDVIFTNAGISKQHAKIDVYADKIILTDIGSRNGTYVNGTKIQSIRLQGNENLALHEVFFAVIQISDQQLQAIKAQAQQQMHSSSYHQLSGSPQPSPGAFGTEPLSSSMSPQPDYHNRLSADRSPSQQILSSSSESATKPTILQLTNKYLNEVVLPGVLKIPELMEFRWVLASFMGAFIIFVTSLSAIPLMRILKASIEKESQRRALTIARTLAKVNRASLMQGIDSAVSTEIAQREPGVEKALIISNVDGNIIAPASQAGQVPDLPFIHDARREGKEIVKQIDDSTIGALVPVEFYNPETGSQAVTAYAAIIYNMGSLAVDDSRTLSLFIQTFFIALVVGSILFYFLLKTIEFPLVSLNEQLDRALKESHNELHTNYQFPVLKNLVANINSALSRMGDSHLRGPAALKVEHDRSAEMNNLVQLIGFGAIGITSHDLSVQAMNAEFEIQTGIRSTDLLMQPVDKINDQAMRLSIQDLIERAKQNPQQIATNELEISGNTFMLGIQAVLGTDQIAYFLVTLLPHQGGGSHSS